ncbi:MAG: enoyl-CoA hydratase [Rhizobiaceae bacterium]
MSKPDNAAAEPILINRSNNGVAHLRLNRPDKLNALSGNLLDALQMALDTIAADPNARCVVLSGSGKAFCTGHDLAEMRAKPDKAYYQDLFARCGKVMQSIVNLPVPVIAQVHGIATAAGCQLVASCDLAIAARSTRFAVSGINVGLFCSTPAVALSRNVLAKNAFDMLVTGEFISAETAVAYGLINQAVDDAALEQVVQAKVETILRKDANAVRYGKAMFQKQRGMALADAYAFAGEVMACNMMEPDTSERIDAFIEKRHPRIGHSG